MLEGWAIVDNTADEDWDQRPPLVVSGRPISFIWRLHEPRYVQRPTAELPRITRSRRQVLQGSMGCPGNVPELPAAPAAVAMAAAARRRWQQPGPGCAAETSDGSTERLNRSNARGRAFSSPHHRSPP